MNIFNKIYCRVFQFGMKCAVPFMPYRKPTILSSQDEIVDVLKSKGISSCLVVTDKGIVNCGLLDPLKKILETGGIRFVVFDETVPNPTSDNVESARDMYIDNNLESIIALGGGSAMDLAKGVGARIAKPKKSIQKMAGLLKICKRIPTLIAIPTTSGTGSEVTITAVITDSKTHHKYTVNDFSLIPHYAVLDYKVTLGLPKHITSTTGMDALTHAIEAYIGKTRTPETKKMAMAAVSLIVENLKTCYHDPKNSHARSNMLRASHYAGIAFRKSYVGYVHAIAHTLGGKYGVPHGLANAIILPIMLEEYGSCIYKKLGDLARISCLANYEDKDEIAAKKLINWIYEANKEMGIPANIDVIKEEDIPELAAYASKEGNPLYPVPKLMDKDELAKMYLKIKNKEI